MHDDVGQRPSALQQLPMQSLAVHWSGPGQPLLHCTRRFATLSASETNAEVAVSHLKLPKTHSSW